jgi:saccharopine dehydrogenase (NAD+, L-lysine-forming)
MRVLLLGTGAVGAVIARHLVTHRAISGLTLADREPGRAAALAGALAEAERDGAPSMSGTPPGRSAPPASAGAGVQVATLDAGDAGALRRTVDGHQVVVNAVLPRFNGRVMDAALAAGSHYVDLAAGEEDQLARHASWVAAGRVALHGMGEDPGISNVLARLGADRLDSVDVVRVRDGEFSDSDDTPLACLFSTETFLEEAVSPARVFRDGTWASLPPWSGREIYPFPPPVGPQPVYAMPHEEVDTLPRFIGKGIREVDFKLAIPDAMQERIAFLDRIGMTRRDEVRVGGAGVRPLAVLAAVLPQPAQLAGRVRGAAIVLVEIEGRRDGRRVRHVLHAAMTHDAAWRRHRATATSWLTGTGGAAGTIAIATGRLADPGVWSPEQVDPAPILAILSELGLVVEERTEIVSG